MLARLVIESLVEPLPSSNQSMTQHSYDTIGPERILWVLWITSSQYRRMKNRMQTPGLPNLGVSLRFHEKKSHLSILHIENNIAYDLTCDIVGLIR